jgi:predicted RNA-binding protein with PIN domain
MGGVTARLIVDGNNVMGSRPDGWWRDRARATRALVERLGAWAARTGEEILVVFDGRPPQGLSPTPEVDVRFAARGGRDAADDVIAAVVADDAEPETLRVVTSDSGLAGRVREHGATVIGARGFRDDIDRA